LVGVGRSWSASVGVNQLWSASVGVDQLWSASVGVGRRRSELVGVGRSWSASVGVDRLWSGLVGVGRELVGVRSGGVGVMQCFSRGSSLHSGQCNAAKSDGCAVCVTPDSASRSVKRRKYGARYCAECAGAGERGRLYEPSTVSDHVRVCQGTHGWCVRACVAACQGDRVHGAQTAHADARGRFRRHTHTCAGTHTHRADLEWKVIYVGSADSDRYDQELDSVLVGPVPIGVSKFVLQVRAIHGACACAA